MSAGLELRIYRCPGPAQLARLNAMLGEEGLAMFARNGVEVLDAWTVAVGAATPVLAYLCPFESMEARAAAWATVDADDGWQQTKKKYGEGIGPLTSELEFWWLEGVTPLDLAPGSGPVDLLSSTGRLPGLPGQFRVAYGPTGRWLALGHPTDLDATSLPAGGRRVRLRRVGWSPAVAAGAAWSAEAAPRAVVQAAGAAH